MGDSERSQLAELSEQMVELLVEWDPTDAEQQYIFWRDFLRLREVVNRIDRDLYKYAPPAVAG